MVTRKILSKKIKNVFNKSPQKYNKLSKKYKIIKFLGGGEYKNKRLELDNGNDSISIFSRVGRRTTDKYINIYNREGLSPNYKEYKISKKHLKDVALHRNKLKSNFSPKGILKNIIDEYHKYGLNQGEEGACSFVGFLNLVLINKVNDKLLNKDVIPYWGSYWDDFGKSTATDIGETLDDMVENKCFKKGYKKYINYIPMRSENNNENFHNIKFWTNTNNVCQRFDISKKEYELLPWLFQQANYIEALLDKGIPVEINAREHSRTCIAYNDDYLLFADNWGHEGYKQSWDDDSEDNFFGGFSTVKKWAIYSHVRDLVWISKK